MLRTQIIDRPGFTVGCTEYVRLMCWAGAYAAVEAWLDTLPENGVAFDRRRARRAERKRQ